MFHAVDDTVQQNSTSLESLLVRYVNGEEMPTGAVLASDLIFCSDLAVRRGVFYGAKDDSGMTERSTTATDVRHTNAFFPGKAIPSFLFRSFISAAFLPT